MKELFVIKESNTFSETLEVLGLAYIIDNVFQRTLPVEKPDILIEDRNSYYLISLSKDLDQKIIDRCNYFDFFRYIGKKVSDKNLAKFRGINYEVEKEVRGKYYKLTADEKNETDQKPHPFYDVIRMCASMGAYSKSFLNCRLFENHFPFLLNKVFMFYSSSNLTDREQLVKNIDRETRAKGIQINKINSLQDLNPDKGKGVNQNKANGIKPGPQKNFWLQQLLRFSGLWQGFVSGYISKKDYKSYAIVPSNISFEFLRSVYCAFRNLIQSAGSVKFDIILVLFLTQKLIEHSKHYQEEWSLEPINNKISGFQFAYYKSLGQRPAVTNIGFLGLPKFIKFESEEDGNIWLNVLTEHVAVIRFINDNHSSNVKMLQCYRQFISASDFVSFFEFQLHYATYLINSYLQKNHYVKIFSIQNMEVLMGTNQTYQKIISNKGFQAIAKAIRNSTIIPIIHKNNKDAVFGLSQKFKIASKDKDTFASEVSQFIQLYNERIMLKDYKKREHQKYVTTEELSDFYKLLDDNYSAKLLAGMLIAFGFAKEANENQ